MKYGFELKTMKNVLLSICLSFFIESYIVLVENNYLISNFSLNDFINIFSIKEFAVFFVFFAIVFLILFDENKKIRLFNFLYTYRLHISISVIILAVIFQIHGSSINEMNLFHVSHKPLLGVSRPIRSDEYVVNTMFAFSQYLNDFAYFSDIVRATTTDMFIIYGQPVLDVATIFRPFLIGYLFLKPAQGLSFFWIGRLVFLLLVSFEFGLLLTNRNKALSLSYALLVTFSPIVQWWFAVNGLVEQLIFGQLGVLLIYWYMTVDDYKKRVLIALGLMISVGTFILVFYPSWQIPFAYVFVLLAIWVFLKNMHDFKVNKKDFIILAVFLLIFSIIMIHVLSNSLDTIKIILNTSYPSSQSFNGGGTLNSLLYYMPTIFYPLVQDNLTMNVCNYSVFIDLFPIPLILSGIVLFYQKTKDKLLIGLLILYALFIIFYLVKFPDLIVDLTLRSHIKTSRIPAVITFLGLLILIRSISNLKDLNHKKLIVSVSVILSVIMCWFSCFEFNNYYLSFMPICIILVYSILFSASFLASSKRNQKIFLICVIGLSFLAGAFANPIDQGADVIYESDFFHHVEKIVEDDPDAIWITQGMKSDSILPAGAKTLNSVNTYPDLEKWQKIDENDQYYEVYNRYAHIFVKLQDKNDTSFNLMGSDIFNVNLNVNDLEKLNVSYIATSKPLKKLSNDNVTFERVYMDHGFRIYHVKYD